MNRSILLIPTFYFLAFSNFCAPVNSSIHQMVKNDEEYDSLSKCKNGMCIPLYSCTPYLQMLSAGGMKEKINTCGYVENRLQVCCPEHESNKKYFPLECGKSKDDKRVIGGDKTELGQFPWIAAFGYKVAPNEDLEFMCAGSLINSRYVLTAAHCLPENKAKLTVIRLGEFNLSSPSDCVEYRFNKIICAPPTIDAKPEKIIFHHDYQKHSKHGADIALIRLDRTVDFKASEGYIMPLCLPPLGFHAEYEAQGRYPIAVGWGMTDSFDHSTASDIPLLVNLPFAEQKKCVRYFQENFGTAQICAGGEENKDTCNGDSGGPLMLFDTKRDLYLQVGIVSFGAHHCGTGDVPGVYTAVSHYINWIAISMEPW